MGFWSRIFWNRPDTPTPPAAPALPQPTPLPVPGVPTDVTGPSALCVALIEEFEDFLPVAKPDVDGEYIVGYGCKLIDGVPVKPGQTIDKPSAHRACQQHAQSCADAVLRAVKVPLTQGQLDALVDFVYNIGIGGLLQSTLLRTINAKQTVTERMFTSWNKIHSKTGQLVELSGLTKRRLAEYQLFLS